MQHGKPNQFHQSETTEYRIKAERPWPSTLPCGGVWGHEPDSVSAKCTTNLTVGFKRGSRAANIIKLQVGFSKLYVRLCLNKSDAGSTSGFICGFGFAETLFVASRFIKTSIWGSLPPSSNVCWELHHIRTLPENSVIRLRK